MKFARTDWIWPGLYAVMLAGIFWGLHVLRQQMLEQLDNPQAQAQWQAWRETAARQSGKDASGHEQPVEGPVQRRQPRSSEPPTVVLLRDHFLLLQVAAVVFSSVFFGFFVLVTRGLTRQGVRA